MARFIKSSREPLKATGSKSNKRNRGGEYFRCMVLLAFMVCIVFECGIGVYVLVVRTICSLASSHLLCAQKS
ncbi:hypothetical protein RclHR1_16030007 [Rhizophagus clarus]|uniref:Uncharacterized protein n=1 Tax=Rhizophagus clarus TaxID=94130 RepID=A0A2Z6R9J3_9GLOM|nr:hypothetical protein RclHR1_16030007 [Rhizophagus clarus]